MSGLFISRLFDNPQHFFMWIFLVVFSICCHEYSHAQVALWEGDPTARDDGHLTLNPLKQMGGMSLLMLAFVGIAWGAVPVNPQRMRRRISPLLVSLAGPFANLLLYIGFTILFYLVIYLNREYPDTFPARNTAEFFILGAVLNFILLVLNMLPAPPLDGYAIFCFFSKRGLDQHSEFVKGFTVALIFLVIFGMQYIMRLGVWLTMQWGAWLGMT
jgi:Zn-dependent protease